MALRLKKKPLAAEDEDRHFLHLAEEDVDVAVRWLEALEAGYRHILTHPESGANRPVPGRPDYQDLQMWVMSRPFQNWVIYFQHQPSSNSLEIVRVLHGAEDRPRHLQES